MFVNNKHLISAQEEASLAMLSSHVFFKAAQNGQIK